MTKCTDEAKLAELNAQDKALDAERNKILQELLLCDGRKNVLAAQVRDLFVEVVEA